MDSLKYNTKLLFRLTLASFKYDEIRFKVTAIKTSPFVFMLVATIVLFLVTGLRWPLLALPVGLILIIVLHVMEFIVSADGLETHRDFAIERMRQRMIKNGLSPEIIAYEIALYGNKIDQATDPIVEKQRKYEGRN